MTPAFLGPPDQAPQIQPLDNAALALILSLIAIFLVFYHHHKSTYVALGAAQ